MKNKTIYYPKSAFNEDITSKISIDNELYDSVIKMFFDSKSIDIKFKKEGFNATVNLETFALNDNFIDNSKKNDVNWDELKQRTINIINAVYAENNTFSAFADMYNFMLNGYDHATSEIKNAISGMDLLPYGISDLETYNGIWCYTPTPNHICIPNKTLNVQLKEQINPTDINNYLIGEISETKLNETLMSSDSIGESFILQDIKSDGTVRFVPMTVTNIYSNLFSDSIRLVITVSINGYDTNICVNAKFTNFDSESYNTTFKLKVDELYYGTETVNGEFAQRIFNLIDRALDIDNTFNFNAETKEISLNFLGSIEESGYKSLIDLKGTPALKIVDDEDKTISELSKEGIFKFFIIPPEA